MIEKRVNIQNSSHRESLTIGDAMPLYNPLKRSSRMTVENAWNVDLYLDEISGF